MVDKKMRKDKKSLTSGPDFEDNRGSNRASTGLPDIDPRIVGLVRLLARKAAERDFERLALIGQSTKPGSRKD